MEWWRPVLSSIAAPGLLTAPPRLPPRCSPKVLGAQLDFRSQDPWGPAPLGSSTMHAGRPVNWRLGVGAVLCRNIKRCLLQWKTVPSKLIYITMD
ncbi:unnamed protein product [Urochloa humidicola]